MKTFFPGFLIFVMLLAGCQKIPAGLVTTVSGTVMDNNRGVPIMNAKIIIQEEKYKFTGEAPPETSTGNPITAISGPDGKYAVTFTTNGAGDEYLIGLSLDNNYLNNNSFQKIAVGRSDTINFNAWQLATLKAHIIVKNNPAPPIWAIGVNASSAKIYGTNNDTIVNLLVVPNQQNGLQFGIQVPGNQYGSYFLQNITLTGFSDTYYQTFTVYPSTFIQL